MPSQPSRSVPVPLALSEEDEEALRRVQLELLAQFDRVCRTHGLSYFAVYGTALGAVRHHGFIPWDDDLDLGMLRTDYDRLLRIVHDNLDSGFFFQTVDSDPYYGCLFAKLRKDDTRCVDRISFGSPQHGGIFIDVFPLDAKAEPGWRRWQQKAMRYLGFRLLYLKSGYHFMRGSSVPSRLIQVMARGAIRVLPRRLLIALTEWPTRVGPSDAPREYVSLFGAYFYDRDTVSTEWIHPLRELPFEDRTIPVFADVEAYLTQIYGDYSQPPPVEQRIGHHEIVELDFGVGS